MDPSYVRTAAILLGLVGAVACVSRPPGGSTPQPASRADFSCDAAPVTSGRLARDASLAGKAGSYWLLVVARAGARAGDSSRAELELRTLAADRIGRDTSRTSYPQYGWTDLDLTDVGARTTGSVDARDRDAPGVLVLESRDDSDMPTIRLRLGATLNRADRRLFESVFTVLEVLRVTDDGFAGTWRSGLFAPGASGTFCARLRQ